LWDIIYRVQEFMHPWGPVFKIDVFNALHMQFGPSEYTSLKNNPSKCSPELKMKTSLELLNIICMAQEPTSVGHCHYKKWS
jgi:hypothetical protein